MIVITGAEGFIGSCLVAKLNQHNYNDLILVDDFDTWPNRAANLIGKKYWIEPNYEEFNKFVTLEKMYNEKKESLIIKHVAQGEIDINHLLV